MENINMGNIIKEKRKALGITQKDLAEKLGVSDKAVSKWERCESLPDVSLIPQIALALSISIDNLFGGDASQDINSSISPVQPSASSPLSADVVQQKINTKYICAIMLCLFTVFFCFFGEVVVMNRYISIINWQYRPLFYSFLIAVVFTLFSARIKKFSLQLHRTHQLKANICLDKVFAVTAAGSIAVILFFSYMPSYTLAAHLSDISRSAADILGAENQSDTLSASFSSHWLAVCISVYIAAAIANMLISERKNTFDKTVGITTAAAAFFTLLHAAYYTFTGALILKSRVNFYAFWLERPKTVAFMEKINIYNYIYAAVIFLMAAALVFILKNKEQRRSFGLCISALVLWQAFSAFRFINTAYDGMGHPLAQLRLDSIVFSIAFVAAVPHLVMMLNCIIKKEK